MKRINIVITVVAVVVLIVAICLVAKIARVKPVRKVDLSAEVGLETTTLEEKDIEQKRNLIWKYHDQRNVQPVIPLAEEYLKLVPKDEGVWVLLAENYMWSDKLTKAERAVKEALKLNPKSPWGLRTLAEIYRLKAEQSPRFKQEYLSKAQLKIEEALGIAPDNEQVNKVAALVYLAQGKRGKALEAINKVLKLKPEDKYYLGIKEQILSGAGR